MAGVRRHFLIMGDDNNGVPLPVERIEKAENLLARLAVEVSGGLVREDDRRVVHERPRDRDPLALSAGKLAWAMIEAISKVDALKRALRSTAALVGRNPPINERQLDVPERRGAWEQVKRLEHKADFLIADRGELVIGHGADLTSVQTVRTLRRVVEASE